MADCSELSKSIMDIVEELAKDPNIKNLDDTLQKMNEFFPEIRRQDMVDAIWDTMQANTRKEAARRSTLRAIKSEVGLDKKLTKDNAALERYLEDGTLPGKQAKPTKEASTAIKALRKTRDNLTKWVETSDPAMKEKLGQTLDDLSQKLESGEFGVDKARSGKLHDELKIIQDQIDESKSKILDERKMGELQGKIDALNKNLEEGTLPEKSSRRTFADTENVATMKETISDLRSQLQKSEPAQKERIQKQIDTLQKHLDDGTAPEVRQEPAAASDEIQTMIDTRDDLRSRLAQSEPVQRRKQVKQIAALETKIAELKQHLEDGTLPAKAEPSGTTPPEAIQLLRDVRDGLEKQIRQSEPAQMERLTKRKAELDEMIASGDVHPKVKEPPLPESKELAKAKYEVDLARQKIRTMLYNQKPKNWMSHIAEPFNAARAIMTSMDLSGMFRQGGLIFLAHPVRSAKAIPDMFRAMMSDQAQSEIHAAILNRPLAPLSAKAKLYLGAIDSSEGLTMMEEGLMSRWVGKIPGIRASQRAYVTFLNKLRADSFDAMVEGLGPGGEVTLKEAQAIAMYINEATGRGMHGTLDNATVLLNTVFFAPRFTFSRFQMLLGHPLWGGEAAGGTMRSRKLIAEEYARMFMGVGVVVGVGGLAGGEFSFDPESADFGKIRFGNARLDPLAGIGQTMIFTSRTFGSLYRNVMGEKQTMQADAFITRFFRSKLSPMTGTAWTLVSGKNAIGQKQTPTETLSNLAIPMTFSDIYEVYKENNIPEATILSLLTIGGMGLSVYDSENRNKKTSSAAVYRPK